MESKRGLLIIALILVFILTLSNNIYTGQGTARPPSGTCHRGCCYDKTDIKSLQIYECIEEATKNNKNLLCTIDSNSLNHNCRSIRFPADLNIPGLRLAGCYVRELSEEERAKKSAASPGVYTDSCNGDVAINQFPSTTGGCNSLPKYCRGGQKCSLTSGEAKCV